MDSAFAWLQYLAEWLGRFVPRWHVMEPTQAAVKVVCGRKILTQTDGILVWWPAITSVTIYPVARQANDLRAQTIVTADQKSYVVGGMIVYEISDVEAIVCHTFDPDDTIRDVALTAIHDVCIQHSESDLLAYARSGRLDTEMRREARKQLDGYGVRVLRLTLTDLAPCRVYRLVQSQPTEKGMVA